jgi:hypothetical protein
MRLHGHLHLRLREPGRRRHRCRRRHNCRRAAAKSRRCITVRTTPRGYCGCCGRRRLATVAKGHGHKVAATAAAAKSCPRAVPEMSCTAARRHRLRCTS